MKKEARTLLDRKTFILRGLVLVSLVFMAFSAALFNGFVWDDDVYLTDSHLRGWTGLKEIWTDPGSTDHPYYPLTHTTFWLESRIFGSHPGGYHFDNVLLQAVNAVLLWRILVLLQVPAAWFCAAVFAVHPVQVESVAWVAERKNLLSVLFYLLAAFHFLRFYRANAFRPRVPPLAGMKHYRLALIFFVMSMLSKTAYCTWPLALLAVLWWKNDRLSRHDLKWLSPFFLIAFCFGVFTVFLEKNHVGAQGAEWDLTGGQRIVIAGRAFWFYIANILWPSRLAFFYPRWPIVAGQAGPWLFPLFAAVFTGALWLYRSRIGKGALVAILFFVLGVLPALGLINFYLMRYTFVADHLQYLGSIGLIVFFVSGWGWICRFLGWRGDLFFRSLLTGVIVAFAALTWQQTRVYRNDFTLYSDVIFKNPNSWIAYNNRGLIYLEHSRLNEALSDFNMALKLNPDLVEGHNNRGTVFFLREMYGQALAEFDLAVKADPYSKKAFSNRAATFCKQGKYEQALRDYGQALKLDEDYIDALDGRGDVFAIQGRHDLALADFSRAIRLDPDNGRLYLKRAVSLISLNDPGSALRDVQKATDLGASAPDKIWEELRLNSGNPAINANVL